MQWFCIDFASQWGHSGVKAGPGVTGNWASCAHVKTSCAESCAVLRVPLWGQLLTWRGGSKSIKTTKNQWKSIQISGNPRTCPPPPINHFDSLSRGGQVRGFGCYVISTPPCHPFGEWGEGYKNTLKTAVLPCKIAQKGSGFSKISRLRRAKITSYAKIYQNLDLTK